MSDTTAAIRATTLGCSLTCKDLEASIRFYRDAIGFTVAQTFESDGKVAAAVVAAGDCRIVLNQDDGKLGWDRIKGQGFYLQINVVAPADVDEAFRGTGSIVEATAFSVGDDRILGAMQEEHRRVDAIDLPERIERVAHDQTDGEEGILLRPDIGHRRRRAFEHDSRLGGVGREIDGDRRSE